MNVASFIDRQVARDPSRVALAGKGGHRTYGDLLDDVNRSAWRLREAGCGAGDRVLVCVPDAGGLIAAFLGALRLGAIPVPVNPSARATDYAFYLSDTGARVVVAHSGTRGELSAAMDRETHALILVDGETDQRFRPRLEPAPVRPTDAACFLYTSGTTGRQKAAVHSHGTLAAASDIVGRAFFGIQPHDRLLSLAKPFFAFGLGFGVLYPLSAGAAIVPGPARPELEEIADLIHRERPTILCGVPSALAVLLHAAETWLTLKLSSLRFIVSAGEPLPPRIFEGFRARFGVEVLDGLGSTEMLTHFISNRPGGGRPGSCGKPIEGYEVRLVDEAGRDVADGEIGLLLVKGPTAFGSYWGNPEQTARTRRDDWIATGDRLYRDGDGGYHHCGRADDMLKVGGLWARPRDIELALGENERVSQAVVTTREDRMGRRRLVAYLVLKDGRELASADLLRHLQGRVPEHMLPSCLMVVPEMPLTPSGKINRSALPAPDWGMERHGG